MSDKKTFDPLLFEHEMVNVTKTLARGEKLQVKIQGTSAHAGNGFVVLPAVDRSKPMELRDVQIARGYVDHEAKHQRSTDIEGKWIEKAKDHSRFAESMLQAVEDIRIERHQIEEYQGAKVNLETTADAVLDLFEERMEAGDIEIENQNQLLPMATSIAGRKLLDYNIPDSKVDTLKKHCGDKVWAMAEALAKRAVQMQDGKAGTKDAYELAMWAVNNPPDEKNPNEPPPMPGQGEGQGEGQGQGDGGNAKGDGQGSGQGKSGGKDGPASAKGAGGMDAPEWTERPVFLDAQDALNDALGAKERGVNESIPYMSDWNMDTFSDRNGTIRNGQRAAPFFHEGRVTQGKAAYGQYRTSVIRQIGGVKAKFERKLAVMVNRSWERGLSSGDLDRKRLTQAYIGNENVYRKRDGVPEIDACASILVDLSGSMAGREIETATRACIAIAEALNKMGVPFEITGHKTDGGIEHNGMLSMALSSTKSEWDAGEYDDIKHLVLPVFDKNDQLVPNRSAWSVTRWAKQHFIVFKDFNDSLFRSEGLIGCMPYMAGGGTVEADAILKSWARLIRRPEKRKLMLVICDGGPGGGGIADEYQWSVAVNKMLEADPRAELACIGIGTNAPEGYFSNVAVVNKMQQLPEVVFKTLEGLITTAHSKNMGKALPKEALKGQRRAA